jgi:hypothetical protein
MISILSPLEPAGHILVDLISMFLLKNHLVKFWLELLVTRIPLLSPLKPASPILVNLLVTHKPSGPILVNLLVTHYPNFVHPETSWSQFG